MLPTREAFFGIGKREIYKWLSVGVEGRGIRKTDRMSKSRVFKVGDRVRPKPEWICDPNNVPTGRIVRIEPFGSDGAIFVEGEHCGFAGYMFEIDAEEEQ